MFGIGIGLGIQFLRYIGLGFNMANIADMLWDDDAVLLWDDDAEMLW